MSDNAFSDEDLDEMYKIVKKSKFLKLFKPVIENFKYASKFEIYVNDRIIDEYDQIIEAQKDKK